MTTIVTIIYLMRAVFSSMKTSYTACTDIGLEQQCYIYSWGI